MIHVEDSIIIERPLAEVFAFIADQTNAPRWQPDIIEVRRITGDAIGIGTKHTAVRKFMGRRMELTNEYIGFVPNYEVTFSGDGSVRFQTSYFTESVDGGTKVMCRMQMEPGGLLGLAEPLIAAGLKRDFATNFRDLKTLLEAESVGAAIS